MITIKDLPIAITVDKIQYNFSIFVTAWNKLCVSYRNAFDRSDTILSCVVEPKGKPFIPCNYKDVADAVTIEEAIFMCWGRLMEMIKKVPNRVTILKEQE